MWKWIILLLIISSLSGDRTRTRKTVRCILAAAAIFYAIRFILSAGFRLLALIAIIWAVVNILLPFIKGFGESFRKEHQDSPQAEPLQLQDHEYEHAPDNEHEGESASEIRAEKNPEVNEEK